MKAFARLRTLVFCFTSLCLILVSTKGQAQNQSTAIPGPNINMVSGTGWPGGDPFLQRQNEPSIAASSRNPLHLLAAANDYRAVDLPGLLGGEENGDAWIGLYTSLNGGLSWTSTMLPGCSYAVPDCAGAPGIQGLQAAADPLVRTGTNGLFYLSGIAFNRGDKALGSFFVATFIDNNNKERGNPIKFVRLSVIDSGTSGQFLDKPWLAVDIPRTGAKTISIPQDAGGTPFPAGNVYTVYSRFVGSTVNNPHSQVLFSSSTDGGQTWGQPTKLSESFSINQGTNMAINPTNGDIYITWRVIENPSANEVNSIVFVKSSNQGKTFTKPAVIATINPFDQGDSSTQFRTRAVPTMAVDGNGVVYVAWSQRGIGPGGDARIVMSTSTNTRNWSTPSAIDNPPVRGHQMMPAAAFAGGKLMFTWSDFRDDHTIGVFTPLGGGQFSEQRAAPCAPGSANCDTEAQIFTPSVSDAGLHRRHTMDVRVTQANPGAAPAFEASTRVSRYKVGVTPDNPTQIRQLQFNPPNLPMFKKGTVPFMGDYIDLFPSVPFVKDSLGKWTFNTSSSSTPVFHTVWADNRDVRPPRDSNWANYKVPTSAFTSTYGLTSIFDPSQLRPECSPGTEGQTGIRNQNIYTAIIAQGLVAGTLGNTKPLLTPSGASIQRGFVVFVQNKTDVIKKVTLNIQQPPLPGLASFAQSSTLTSIPDISIAPRSSISRTVYITSTDKYASATVTVNDPVTNALLTFVVLNPDSTNPTIVNPDTLTTADIQNTEVFNANLSEADIVNNTPRNADIVNADIVNADIVNADIVNADIVNADIVNADIVNADIVNADIVNADIVNADIVNADIVNADIVNADIVNSAVSDAMWSIKNSGNTAANYHIKILTNNLALPTGAKLQLLLHRTPLTPTSGTASCKLEAQVQNILVASIPDPTLNTNPTDLNMTVADITNSSVKNATLALAPGEIGRVTLRMVGVSAAVAKQFFQTFKVGAGNQSSPLALIITSFSLPDAVFGNFYSQTLQATGGTLTPASTPYSWDIQADPLLSGLPPGLTLLPNGTLSGTPTATGVYSFKVIVKDTGDSSRQIPQERDIQTLLLTITKASATLSFTNLNQPYDGTAKSVTVVTTPPSLSGVSITYNGSSLAPTNAATYNVVATLNNINYQTAVANATLTITRAAASVTPIATSKTYGEADPTFTGSLSGFLAGDGVTAAYSRTTGETVAGSPYTISAVLSPAAVLGNYTITSNTAGFTINKATASVTPAAASKTYGSADPLLTGSLSGFLAGDGVTAAYSRTTGETVAGSPYTISASLSPAAVLGNYTITSNTAGFTINPAIVSVTPNAASKTYGAADPALTGTLSGFLGGDGVTAAYSRTAGETVAGSPYTISAVLSPAGVLGNYTITYNTAAFTITKATASVAPNPAAKTYGTADPALTGTLSGFVATDGVTAAYSRTAGESVAGSPYTISATLNPAAVLGNYSITYNTAAFTINKATASVTPDAASKIYGFGDPGFAGTQSGFVPTDGVAAAYSRTAGETVAGSPYTISAALNPAAVLVNYSITYNTAVFTINKASASVTPNAASKIYGSSDPLLAGALSGFIASDGVIASYSRTAGESVGGSLYTISAVLSPAGVLGNYTITYNTATFTINKATASVTPAAASKTYGTADLALTGTLSGFIGGDGVTASYSRTGGETVALSPYPISATLSPAAILGNYTIAYNIASFTINKATASVTPAAASKTYGSADPLLTGSLSGFLAGDNVTAAYSRLAGDTVAGNPYTISAVLSPAGVLGNYTIAYNTASFTISKANTTTQITSTSPNPSYPGQAVAVTFVVGVVAPGGGTPTGSVTVSDGTVMCTAAVSAGSCSLTPTITGTKTLTATYTGDSNFIGSFGTATQTVRAQFTFTGFLTPLKSAGTYAAPTSSGKFNRGQNITIKWQLRDANGNFVPDQVAASVLTVVPNAACTGIGAGTPIPLSPSATGSTVLRYESNQYVFNWDTSHQAEGCYNIVLRLSDGSIYSTIVKLED